MSVLLVKIEEAGRNAVHRVDEQRETTKVALVEISIIGEVNNGVPASYKAKVLVNWEPNGGIDPGIISGDQIICSGFNPTQSNSKFSVEIPRSEKVELTRSSEEK